MLSFSSLVQGFVDYLKTVNSGSLSDESGTRTATVFVQYGPTDSLNTMLQGYDEERKNITIVAKYDDISAWNIRANDIVYLDGTQYTVTNPITKCGNNYWWITLRLPND